MHADDGAHWSSPANAEAAQLYRENMKEYVKRVRCAGFGSPLRPQVRQTVENSWIDD